MSVVAVKIHKDKIVISADSQTSYLRNKLPKNERGAGDAKIFSINNMTIGAVGSCEVSSIFKLFCQNRSPESSTKMGILNFIADFFDWAKGKGMSDYFNNEFIIILENKIFRADGFDISEIENFTAIGSGMFLALGAMTMDADTEKAIDIAKKYDLYCGGETLTIERKTDQKK